MPNHAPHARPSGWLVVGTIAWYRTSEKKTLDVGGIGTRFEPAADLFPEGESICMALAIGGIVEKAARIAALSPSGQACRDVLS